MYLEGILYAILEKTVDLVFSDCRRANTTNKHASKSMIPEQLKREKAKDGMGGGQIRAGGQTNSKLSEKLKNN